MARAMSWPAMAEVLIPCPPKAVVSHTPGCTSPICGMRWTAKPMVPDQKFSNTTVPSSG